MKTFEAKPSVVRVTNLPLNLLFLNCLTRSHAAPERLIDIYTLLYTDDLFGGRHCIKTSISLNLSLISPWIRGASMGASGRSLIPFSIHLIAELKAIYTHMHAI